MQCTFTQDGIRCILVDHSADPAFPHDFGSVQSADVPVPEWSVSLTSPDGHAEVLWTRNPAILVAWLQGQTEAVTRTAALQPMLGPDASGTLLLQADAGQTFRCNLWPRVKNADCQPCLAVGRCQKGPSSQG